jgi:hypothetical protein
VLIERRNRLAGFVIVGGERPAAKKIVRPRRWSAGDLDPLKGDQELSQFGGKSR